MTVLHSIFDFLRYHFPFASREYDNDARPSVLQFEPSKLLCERDSIVIAMLNSPDHESTCYVISDPDLPDCPITFVSDGFCAFTQYPRNEIEGRNCRFLQGKGTEKADVDRIRKAIKEEKGTSVNLLNYRKDGSTFANEFFISPLYAEGGDLAYFIGVQCPVSKYVLMCGSIRGYSACFVFNSLLIPHLFLIRLGPGQCAANVG
mmetsp:Transcript_41806/g.97907  ORF Transcript_41806/g.97907 Transcript_41806/m.97907 type:complete len:204 (+) Transcript_41806:470-1081(+)